MSNEISQGGSSDKVSNITQGGVATLIVDRELKESGSTDKEQSASIGPIGPGGYDEFLTRPTLITYGQLTSLDVEWADILSSADPYTLWSGFTANNQKLQHFRLLRADMEVTITVTPPSNAYGMYCFNAVCEGADELSSTPPNAVIADGVTEDNPYTACQDIFGLVDVSLGTTVTLTLPYVGRVDALTLSTGVTAQNPWRLNLWAWSPIQNSLNSEAIACDYKIYARLLPGYDLTVPSFQAKNAKVKSSTTKIINSGDAKKGQMGGMIAKAGTAASMIGAAVPFLAPFTTPLAIGAGVASKIADMFGFTREANVSGTTIVQNRTFSALAATDGEDASEVVALSVGNSTTIDPRVGGATDDDPCSFQNLFSRWTLVAKTSWATTDAATTELLRIPVTPGLAKKLLNVWYLQPCGYVGLPFRYWRGGMEYMIIVPVSPYHRGMLQLVWDPQFNSVITTDPTNIMRTAIFDVTVSNTLTAQVGYDSTIGVKTMSLCATDGSLAEQEMCNGSLSLRVQSVLQAPLAGSVDVLVLARAMSDMRFGVPTFSVWNAGATGFTQFSGAYRFQAGGIGDDAETQDDVVVLVGPKATDSYPTNTIHFGEEIASVRPLLQKFSPVQQLNSNIVASSYALPHFWPPPKEVSDDGTLNFIADDGFYSSMCANFTWLGWYSAMFVGIRGSTRYKVLRGTTEGMYGMSPGFWTDMGTSAGNYTGYGVDALETSGVGSTPVSDLLNMGIQYTGPNGGCEFTLPYYCNKKYINTRIIPVLETGTLVDPSTFELRSDFLHHSASWGGTLIFQAGGPDIAPVRFRRVPAITKV